MPQRGHSREESQRKERNYGLWTRNGRREIRERRQWLPAPLYHQHPSQCHHNPNTFPCLSSNCSVFPASTAVSSSTGAYRTKNIIPHPVIIIATLVGPLLGATHVLPLPCHPCVTLSSSPYAKLLLATRVFILPPSTKTRVCLTASHNLFEPLLFFPMPIDNMQGMQTQRLSGQSA